MSYFFIISKTKRRSVFRFIQCMVFSVILIVGVAGNSNAFFASNQNGDLYQIDYTTGDASYLSPGGSNGSTEIETDSANEWVYMEGANGSINLDRISPCPRNVIFSVNHEPGALNGLEFVGSTLYGTFIDAPGVPATLVVVDPATGDLTLVGASPGLAAPSPVSGLAYDTVSSIMYGVTAGGAPAILLSIDLATGIGTPIAPIMDSTGAPLDRIGSIEFGPDGNLYGGLTSTATFWPSYLVQIDTVTGVATPVGDTGVSITGLTEEIDCSDFSIPTMNEWGMIVFTLSLGISAFWVMRKNQFRIM